MDSLWFIAIRTNREVPCSPGVSEPERGAAVVEPPRPYYSLSPISARKQRQVIVYLDFFFLLEYEKDNRRLNIGAANSVQPLKTRKTEIPWFGHSRGTCY